MPLSSRVLEFCPCTESRSGTSQQRIEWFWSALLGAARPASPDLQQLEAMARDRAAVRQSVEQLAAGQEQMARNMARLQAAEQDIRHRILAPPPQPAAAPARKPAPPPAQPAPQISATPAPPAQISAAPPPPALPPPSRPPMPVR